MKKILLLERVLLIYFYLFHNIGVHSWIIHSENWFDIKYHFSIQKISNIYKALTVKGWNIIGKQINMSCKVQKII